MAAVSVVLSTLDTEQVPLFPTPLSVSEQLSG